MRFYPRSIWEMLKSRARAFDGGGLLDGRLCDGDVLAARMVNISVRFRAIRRPSYTQLGDLSLRGLVPHVVKHARRVAEPSHRPSVPAKVRSRQPRIRAMW